MKWHTEKRALLWHTMGKLFWKFVRVQMREHMPSGDDSDNVKAF